MDEVDEFDAGRGGFQTFACLLHIAAFEEGLDDGGACGRTPYAVLFHGFTQRLVINQFASGFHGAEQGGFRVRFGRCGPFFRQFWFMRALLAFHEVRQYLLFVFFFLLVVFLIGRRFGRFDDHAPARFQNLLAGGLEGHFFHLPHHRGSGENAVGIEDGDEMAAHFVIYRALFASEVLRRHSRGNDGMVVGDFAAIEVLFAFGQFLAVQRGNQLTVGVQSL